MDAIYAEAYSRLYHEHWWWRVRERILIRKLDELLGGAQDARILDVGCGAGLFFDVLERYGHVEGIESDPVAEQHSGRWHDRIHVGTFETFESEARYDLILMLDVIEHLQQPDVVLREAAARLAPRGAMLITVPAFNWLWTTHDDLNHHVRRYSAAGLVRSIKSAGLEVQETRYMFQSLIVPKLMVRAKETLSASSPSVPHVPGPVVNRALTAWFACENAIAGWLPFGSSLMAVARAARA